MLIAAVFLLFAFAGCGNIVLIVGRDSCAREYAIENEIDFAYPDALDLLNS